MTILAILGASGDMARRLLFPALLDLEAREELGDVQILGYALEDWTTEQFVGRVKDGIESQVRRATLAVPGSVWRGGSLICSGNISDARMAALRLRIRDIQFRVPTLRLFHASDLHAPINNRLVSRLRPSESISLPVQGRKPGLGMESQQLALRADYAHQTDADSYCQLILDVLEGDRTPFLRFDEVEWAWRDLTPVL